MSSYYDPHALYIHIDGSAYKNPGGRGGFAMVIEYPDHLDQKKEIHRFSFLETTNNRMELRACIKAFEFARKNLKAVNNVERVIIVTDSRYVVQVYEFVIYWRRNGWRTKDGRPIENLDLCKKLLSMRQWSRVKIELEWQKGKTTDLSKEVDQNAKQAASRGVRNVDFGYQRGGISRTKIQGGASTMFPARSQEISARIYRKAIKGIGSGKEYKIFFDLFLEEENKYTAKYYAYTSLIVGNRLHRGHCYQIFFNDNPTYPKIDAIITEFKSCPGSEEKKGIRNKKGILI